MSLKDDWPWQESYIRLFVWTCVLLGIIGSAIGYAMAGVMGLWFLSALPIGLVWWLVYGAVGKKVDELQARYQQEPGDVEIGLLVVGRLQAPGVIVKREASMVFHPIVGDAYEVPIDELELFRDGNMLPGKYLWGKRGLIFESHKGTRLAFGVREVIGRRWSRSFERSKRFK